jgi:hyaluronan synthase
MPVAPVRRWAEPVHYDIPEVTFRPRRGFMLIPVSLIVGGSLYLHRASIGHWGMKELWPDVIWGVSLSVVLAQFILSWCQRPYTAGRRRAAYLDSLRVAMVIPCYNEDPAILDRTIYSLYRQTRQPSHVIVVDDGSTSDYTEIRERWYNVWWPNTQFVWVRQDNAGKKHAQAAAFRAVPYADIYATMDSDSALDSRAVEEGLKPFASDKIVSVAGLEMAYNLTRNVLTRAIGARSLAFQLFAMSAQSSAAGNVIINPGAFSLYRGWLIHEVLPAYLGEKFFGVPVTLGDDTALSMYALYYGRAVHQPTAVSMPVYPEKLSHHLRQWTRWMRASTIRTLWRLRYLRIRSYAWWFVLYQQYAFFASVAVSIAAPLAWPASERLVTGCGIALVVWPLAVAMRLITVKRSDIRWTAWLSSVALLPFAALWYLLVLRQIRFYGVATCNKQGWVTRKKVEVTAEGTA